MVRSEMLLLLCTAALPFMVRSQVANPCSLTTTRGSVSLSGLNTPAGNMASTPLGNVRINPCAKVTLCDAMQAGSGCCVQVNDTAHPGTSRWISCGKDPTPGHVGTGQGIVLKNGPSCGYVFATGNEPVQASISFVCDQTATGAGRVSADTTSFLKLPTTTGAGATPGGAPGAPGSKKPVFDANIFCNLNFTWHTSLVCAVQPNKKSGGSSWGTAVILLMLGFGGVFGGITFYRSKQTGADPDFWANMPNHSMWKEVPGMVKDGINFVTSGGQSQTHYSQYAKVSAAAPSKSSKKNNSKTTDKQKPDKKKPDKKPPKGGAGNTGKVGGAEAATISYSDQESAAPRSIMPGTS